MWRKLGREKKPAFDNFSIEIWVWILFFASEVGGERQDQLSEAGHPHLEQACWPGGCPHGGLRAVFPVLHGPEAGCFQPTPVITEGHLKDSALGANINSL